MSDPIDHGWPWQPIWFNCRIHELLPDAFTPEEIDALGQLESVTVQCIHDSKENELF